MIDDYLINKFDRIEDLPISEEMLGAYLEGNLESAEIKQVEMMLQHQSIVTELYEDISNPGDSLNDYNGVDDIITSPALNSIDNHENVYGFEDDDISHFLDNFNLPSFDNTNPAGGLFDNPQFGLDYNIDNFID